MKVYAISNFHKNGHTIRSFCKTCEIKRSTNSKKDTNYNQRPSVRESRNESSRLSKRASYLFDEEYRTAELIRCHERRILTDKNKITNAEWLEALERFNYACAYCGSTSNLSMDHVVPVSKGGQNTVDNLIPACISCNSTKQASEMVEWYTAQIFYSKSRLENIVKYIKSRR